MHFNPDPSKQGNEVILSRKSSTLPHSSLKFNNNDLSKCSHQKYLGIVLDSKLDFNIHIEQKIKRCNKIIRFMGRLLILLPRKSLLTVYKSFVRPRLDCRDILDDKLRKGEFQKQARKKS